MAKIIDLARWRAGKTPEKQPIGNHPLYRFVLCTYCGKRIDRWGWTELSFGCLKNGSEHYPLSSVLPRKRDEE